MILRYTFSFEKAKNRKISRTMTREKQRRTTTGSIAAIRTTWVAGTVSAFNLEAISYGFASNGMRIKSQHNIPRVTIISMYPTNGK